MTKIQTLSLLALLSLGACSTPEKGASHGFAGLNEADKSLVIYGQKEGLRGTQDAFEKGDQIGVFALTPGTTNPLSPDTANTAYIADGNGIFTGAAGGIKLAGTPADIAAYYPYSAEVSGGMLSVDITDQTDASKVDILWGKAASADLLSGFRAPVTFAHKLGLVAVTFEAKDAAHPLPASIKVTAKGVKYGGRLDLLKGELTARAETKDLTVTADGEHRAYLLLMPGEKLSSLYFEFDGETKEYPLEKTVTVQGGKQIALTLRPYSSKVVIPQAAYAEIPLETIECPNTIQVTHNSPDSYFAGSFSSPGGERRNYSILFDTQKLVPLWVAFPLYKDCMTSGNRTDDWDWDPQIPRANQPVLEGSYKNTGAQNYNRGHMMESSARSASKNLNRSTFYYTNMVPQNKKNNETVWANLEQTIQGWVKNGKFDTLYIVAGPVFTPGKVPEYVKDDNNKNVAVPDSLFKVICGKSKADGKWKSMGIKIHNHETTSGESWKSYLVTVKSLEERLGFTFFTHLPADQAADVKSQNNPSNWQ